MTQVIAQKIDTDSAPLPDLRQSVAGVCVSPYQTFVAIRWRFEVAHFEIEPEIWQGLNYAIMRDSAVTSQHVENDGELVFALHPNNYGVLLPADVQAKIADWQWSVDRRYDPSADSYSRRPDGTFRKHQGK